MEHRIPTHVRQLVLRLIGIALGLALLYLALPLAGDHWLLSMLVALAVVAAIVPFTLRRVQAVRRSDRPTLVAAESVLLLLFLTLFAFSSLYLAVNQVSGEFNGLSTRLDAFYFTVVTLSTVGYGDITATGQWARALVSLQILLDVTLIAVSAKVLVGAAKERIGTAD